MALSLTTNKPLLMAMKAQIYDELSRSKSSMLRNNLTLCHCYFLKKPGLLRSFLSISHMREDVESGISVENLTEYICSMKDVTRGLIKFCYAENISKGCPCLWLASLAYS
ncbi:uncharacterized protein LOC126689297 isoform X2 [Quercus robur]|uniref:uncharacterized protein LOC126689297 isoform X2 n=1 Tax=Quercus robur TaxID=38942 RepID=UPI002162518E|nr:uncharacterized protein LOC126689297 isoform X2 [Quercus robur]